MPALNTTSEMCVHETEYSVFLNALHTASVNAAKEIA